MSGSSDSPSFRGRPTLAKAFAAAEIIESETSLAFEAMTPSPTPGKMSALFAWAMWYVVPRYCTGSNGEPVAMRAEPPVHSMMSEGIASAREIGFDSGMMIGRSQCRAISLTMFSLKAPCWAEVPMRMVGLTLRTTSLSSYFPGASVCHPDNSEADRAKGSWKSRIGIPSRSSPREPRAQK